MFPKFAALFLIAFLGFTVVASIAPFTLFSPLGTYSSGPIFAESIAVGDVSGDGKPDLVVADYYGTVSVLLGNGDGTFGTAVTYNSGGVHTSAVVIADVNGDGKPDIVAANGCAGYSTCFSSSTIGVLLGNGDGTFQPVLTYDGDGFPAISTQNHALAVADVNGDGKADILVANECSGNGNCTESAVAVLLGNGDGTFQSTKSYASGINTVSIAVADVNGDGKPDVIVANNSFGASSTSNLGVLLGNGDGTFGEPQTYSSGGGPSVSVAVADVNGDGKPDILAANECGIDSCTSGNIGVLLGNGDGTFQTAKTYSQGAPFTTSLAAADVNGDGKQDLLVTSACRNIPDCTVGSVAVLLGSGDGTFGTPQRYSSGAQGATSVAAADVNGDGRLDVLVTSNCTSPEQCTNGHFEVLLGRKYPSTVNVTTSATPTFIDQPVTFTADITSPYGTIPDGETIFFHIGPIQLGTGTTMNGAAKFTTASLRGTNTIAAAYSGDSNFKPSSGRVQQIVEHFPTTTSLISTPNPSTSGTGVQFTAKITSSAPAAPTGAVVFKNGSTVIGTAAVKSGTAIFRTAKLPVGTFSVTATYTGDTESAASTSTAVSQVVN